MRNFLRGCFVGTCIVGAAFLVAGAIWLLKTFDPWVNAAVIGVSFILGMGEIFRRTGGP